MEQATSIENFIFKFHTSSFKLSERARIVEINFECDKENLPNHEELMLQLSLFPLRDKFKISLKDIAENSISIFGSEDEKEKYIDFTNQLETGEIVSITISIDKNIEDNRISIYNYNSFVQWLSNKDLLSIMEVFSELLDKRKFLIFEIFSENILFSTNTMLFISANSTIDEINYTRADQLEKCHYISNFYNSSIYELIPEDFHINTDYKDNPLSGIFNKIETLLSMIYLSNTAYIDDGKVCLKIIGQRIVSFSYNVVDNSVISNVELNRIYQWAFTDGNPVDKVNIARNIISLHCKYSDLQSTDEKTFASIQSNFSMYQKKNVEHYIELKNKLGEFIIKLVNEVNELVNDLSNSLKSNIKAFFTFVVTVFLVNIVSKSPLTNIFTKDITVLTELILCGSIVYLIISVSEMNSRMRRIIKGYDALKNNYNNNLLDEDDLKNIFADNQILNEAIKETNKQRNIIVFTWGVLILLLFFAIERLSSSPIIVPIIMKCIHLKG